MRNGTPSVLAATAFQAGPARSEERHVGPGSARPRPNSAERPARLLKRGILLLVLVHFRPPCRNEAKCKLTRPHSDSGVLRPRVRSVEVQVEVFDALALLARSKEGQGAPRAVEEQRSRAAERSASQRGCEEGQGEEEGGRLGATKCGRMQALPSLRRRRRMGRRRIQRRARRSHRLQPSLL